MSRILSVLSVSVLAFSLASSAFGLDYHVNNAGSNPAHDLSNRYYSFFCTQIQTQAHLALPTTLGNYSDPETRLILYNDDATSNSTGYGSGPRYIDYMGNVTVQSNAPGARRILSATDTPLFIVPNDGFYRLWEEPLVIAYNYGGTLTIRPDVLIAGSTDTSGVIQNGDAESNQSNLGFQGGVPFLLPDTVLTQSQVLTVTDESGGSMDYNIIDVYTFAVGSTLNAEGVTFSNNELAYGGALISNGWYEESLPTFYADGNIYVFHDTAIAFNNLNRAVFDNNRNRTGPGAAIQSHAWSLTEANNARFFQNESADGGGAIHADQSILYAQGNDTLFSENRTGGGGGAISALNSALYLKGADFRNNTAQDLGGAILFQVDDGFRYDIVVGAYANTSSEFRGNKEQYVSDTNFRANSIAFGGSGSTTGTAFMLVDVDRNAAFNMYDPMRVQTGANIAVQIDKVGEGDWVLGGTSEMGEAQYATRIDIREGTFQLNGGAALNLTHRDGWDFLFFAPESALVVGIAGKPGALPVELATTRLLLSSETALQLDDSFTVNLAGDDSLIASTLSGEGNLTKTGAGTLTFAGTTNGYAGDVNIREGAFAVVARTQFSTSGQFRVAPATFAPDTGEPLTKLSVVADADSPSIAAQSVDLRGAYIEIIGINGRSESEYVIITSSSDINYDTDTQVSIGGGWPPVGTDYLYGDASFRENELVATIALAWNHSDPTKRHGNFTVRNTKPDVDFTVGTLLANVVGQDLVKKGSGTLELAGDMRTGYDPQTGEFDATRVGGNTYGGRTIIEEGILFLTHAGATGNGDSAIEVESLGTLALDILYGTSRSYDRAITGAGKVLKRGNSIVKLTNTANDYGGGTEVQGGVLQFDDAGVFGTGVLSFTGGTLQNTSKTTLTQTIVATKDNFVRFDTPHDLTVSGGITGAGGLTKTGAETLALTGTNPYQGETQLKEGIVEISRWDNIGLGAIVFDGGTLQNVDVNGIGGDYSISSDGYITLGVYGQVYVKGLTEQECKVAIEEHLVGQLPINPQISVELDAMNKSVSVKSEVVLSNDVRLVADGIFTGEANTNLALTGKIDGEGQLVKNGAASSTLTLSGTNTYSGGTRINSGTIAIATRESLGSGPVLFTGETGVLKNTKEINNFSRDIIINPGATACFDVDGDNMGITSRIAGNGGLLKTGDATLTLSGNNTYTGNTIVRGGALVVDGYIQSAVEVERGAALGGTGKIGHSVNFHRDSIYRWEFNREEDDSPYLHIAGDVYLQNTYFQPITAGDTSTYPLDIEGWTVLKYDGKLLGDGRFLIDDRYCPFIDVSLDYDANGVVRLIAHNRYDPRPLSDIMATSLMMAQRKMNRRPFEQIDNELRNGRYLGSVPIQIRNRQQEARGQAGTVSKNVWGGMTGRTSNFASTHYVNDQWRLNSFGVQAGYSFLSTNWISLGITTGAELPQLKNGYDKIDGSDGYIGLYYGQRIFRMWELKGFLGGGLQSYKLYRRDAKYTYRADFHGDSFQTNIELARPFMLGDWMLRPYIGFDVEYASQAGAVESEASAEFRTYSGTSLTQTFLRVGLDLEKRLERGDFQFGISYSNMIGGQSVPAVYVYYPFAKKGVTSYGAEMGCNVVSLRLGGNRYINQAKTKALFADYMAEIFCDRAGGASQHSVSVGFTSRW